MAAPGQAARCQPPDLPAATRELAGKFSVLPRRRRRQCAWQQRAGLWRGVGDGAHRSGSDPARGDAAGYPDQPQRLSDPARPGRGLCRRTAAGTADRPADDFAGPDGGVACGLGRGQRRAGGGRQPAAGDHRQLRAGNPDPDRRRPGAPAGAGHELRAGDQHVGGDPARARAAARSISTPTTAGSRPMRSTAPGGGWGNRCRSSTPSPNRWPSMSRSTC